MKAKTPCSYSFSVLFAMILGGTASAQFPQGGLPPPPPPPPPPASRPILRPPPISRHPGPPQFGDPLPGLTPDQLAAFAAGKAEFQNAETIESGLGPIFNNVSCVACHSRPAIGGSSPIDVTRFGRTVNGVFDPLESEGGSSLQQFAIDPAVQEVIPADANVIAHRQTTPLFGLGLIEAIPDAAILANASHPSADGVHGRAAMITDVVSGQKRVGRFGWKAQQATLLAFAGDAYRNEMGITNRFFPTENAPNGNTALLAHFDTQADPEDEVDPATGRGDIDAAADYMRLLAPPPSAPPSLLTNTGKNVFQQAGCAACHTPMMLSGPNPVAALNNKQVWLYSDLLLHDMGSLGDGIAQADAGTTEMRTAPLWGLRASGPFLHDGRAPTIDAAIRNHDGEARTSRDHYEKLTPQARQQLLEFLNTL